jgi:hypothetical protein
LRHRALCFRPHRDGLYPILKTSSLKNLTWFNPFFSQWLEIFGLHKFNVGIAAWLFFMLFTAIGSVVFFGLFFVKNIRDRRIRKRLEQNKPVDQKWLRRFNIRYSIVFVALA